MIVLCTLYLLFFFFKGKTQFMWIYCSKRVSLWQSFGVSEGESQRLDNRNLGWGMVWIQVCTRQRSEWCGLESVSRLVLQWVWVSEWLAQVCEPMTWKNTLSVPFLLTPQSLVQIPTSMWCYVPPARTIFFSLSYSVGFGQWLCSACSHWESFSFRPFKKINNLKACLRG